MQEILKDRGQLSYFRKEKLKKPNLPLTDEARKILIKTIVEWTVNHMIWVSTNDFENLFAKIKDYFPHESMSIYYVDKKKSGNYSGQLYNAYRSRHKRNRIETGIRKNNPAEKKNKNDSEPKKIGDTLIVTIHPLPKDIEVIRQRLISRGEPWEEILKDWKSTFEYRRPEIMDLPLSTVLNRWPKFNHTKGSEMVSIF